MTNFISVQLKKASEVDLAKPLCKFIQQSYPGGDAQAEHCRAAEELSKLRKNALGRPLDRHDACLDTLLRYGTARHGTTRLGGPLAGLGAGPREREGWGGREEEAEEVEEEEEEKEAATPTSPFECLQRTGDPWFCVGVKGPAAFLSAAPAITPSFSVHRQCDVFAWSRRYFPLNVVW